jgi:hypothetical protein
MGIIFRWVNYAQSMLINAPVVDFQAAAGLAVFLNS